MIIKGNRFDDTFWGKFIKLWPLITAFAVLVGAAFTTYAKVNDHSLELKQNSIDHKVFDERLIRLEGIQDDLKEIKRLLIYRNKKEWHERD